MNDAWALLERAVALDAEFAPAHAARGNVLLRGGFLDDARAAYERAVALDPAAPAPCYALAEIATLLRDEATAQRWFDAAFARARVFSPPRPLAGARPALVLGLAGPWPRNMPLDFLVDERRWTLHRWFLPDDDAATRALPPVDLIVNALGESAAGAAAIAQTAQVLAAAGRPSINRPERLAGLARDALAATLAGIPGVVVPAAVRLARADIAAAASAAGLGGIPYPLVLRPLDSHGGRGLERLESPAQLDAYLAAHDAPAFDCSAFVDYRSADGYYRKYRVLFVGGVPLAYHLALDRHWMIHYYRTATGETPWMRDEESRFLAAPERTLRTWSGALPQVARAFGLDYVGIDCAQLPDGRLLIFEADTAMLVHGLDGSGDGARRAAALRIGDALQELFAATADRRPVV